MSKSDDLEDEIRGLFTQSIEQIPVKDEVEHASHIANRQRGFIDAIIMICVGAMAIFTALASANWSLKSPEIPNVKQGEQTDE